MSERGSFITEFIYCPKCFEATKRVLLSKEKYLCSTTIPSWTPQLAELPIIAGKVGGLGGSEELETFEYELIPKLEKVICHEMRIAVLADNGNHKIFKAIPESPDED